MTLMEPELGLVAMVSEVCSVCLGPRWFAAISVWTPGSFLWRQTEPSTGETGRGEIMGTILLRPHLLPPF